MRMLDWPGLPEDADNEQQQELTMVSSSLIANVHIT